MWAEVRRPGGWVYENTQHVRVTTREPLRESDDVPQVRRNRCRHDAGLQARYSRCLHAKASILHGEALRWLGDMRDTLRVTS